MAMMPPGVGISVELGCAFPLPHLPVISFIGFVLSLIMSNAHTCSAFLG